MSEAAYQSVSQPVSTIRSAAPSAAALQAVARNRRYSVVATVAMMLAIVIFGGVVGGVIFSLSHRYYETSDLLAAAAQGGFLAGFVAVACVLWSYPFGLGAVLRVVHAKPLDPKSDPQLVQMVEQLAHVAGVPAPSLYVMDDDALNALSAGPDPHRAVVALTTGLRQKLTDEELAGVLAHEIAHVRRGDIRLGLVMATMVGLVVMINDRALNVIRANRPRYKTSKSPGRKSTREVVGAWVTVCLLYVLAAPLAVVIQLATRRDKELAADAAAVEITGNPKALAAALTKLATQNAPLRKMNRALAQLYTVNPLGQGQVWHDLDSVFRTHPPIRKRIERLMGGGAG